MRIVGLIPQTVLSGGQGNGRINKPVLVRPSRPPSLRFFHFPNLPAGSCVLDPAVVKHLAALSFSNREYAKTLLAVQGEFNCFVRVVLHLDYLGDGLSSSKVRGHGFRIERSISSKQA